MNVTVVGGGNIGTQFAAHCSEKQCKVRVYTSKPDDFEKHLSVVNEDGDVIHEGDIVEATDDVKRAFEGTDLIFVTMPAFCMDDIAEKILPYVHEGMKIGIIPGIGGGECAFRECIRKGAIVFGLQRVPSVARLKKYGKTVYGYGYRAELHLAALPNSYTDMCCRIVEKLLDMKCNALPNYLNLTLTPSNPILHTTRLRTLFSNYQEGVLYERVPLFYEEWDKASSELLLKCDDEVQQLCHKLQEFDLSYVKSLKVHYESNDAEQLTNKLCSINSLKGLATPTVQVGDKFIPDLSSRYFTADFPYGLAILKQIADIVQLDVPYIENTLEWYENLVKDRKGFEYSDYGIRNYQQFLEFYLQ